MAGTLFAPMLIHDGVDHTSTEGAVEMPYAIPNRRIELHSPEVDVSGLWWRSVGHTHTAFAGEHFLDILARKAGQDPVEYRRTLLEGGDPRLLGVLELAADKAGWGKRLPEGHAHGVALRKAFSSYVCEIFECSLETDGTPVVHRVTCAVDLGLAINPWNIEQQVQGAVAYALTAALYSAIDFENGQVRQSNFHDYRILRMHEMPRVDVHLVKSAEPPTGIGEPGVPPVAPALANAKLALSGEPTYRLPFVQATRRA
jgi:isoquinoline 1-oxidoreductase beta subunit